MSTLGRASPEPLRVCRNCGLAPGSGLYLRLALRAWKSVQLLQLLTSSHSWQPGAQTSRS